MVNRLHLHLGRVEDELRDVQRHFSAINAVLNCRRDDFSDTVRQNMLTAYEFLDAVVDEDLDLFSDEGLEALLQLNPSCCWVGATIRARSVATSL